MKRRLFLKKSSLTTTAVVTQLPLLWNSARADMITEFNFGLPSDFSLNLSELINWVAEDVSGSLTVSLGGPSLDLSVPLPTETLPSLTGSEVDSLTSVWLSDPNYDDPPAGSHDLPSESLGSVDFSLPTESFDFSVSFSEMFSGGLADMGSFSLGSLDQSGSEGGDWWA